MLISSCPLDRTPRLLSKKIISHAGRLIQNPNVLC
ncbi:hypothetical protein EHW99_2709 [Erwinia amylovora]|uniref:Uncharacterized protein n=1 Tax=Erwinia amylovora (strain CFBP1430) TaxID=665029 RepID=D4HXD0_ERWAC|nr:hypothetical protein EaACW_0880 [Erwinia amylovora ACW56400]QJQ55411.1 hypothetical protein EHX00_2709 [Erwinia amylovora]CBA19821.1 hypothetical protein predicted by Glimmer/Critica [Erwinia amylovora CFBP1430]CCO85311.1 hypothetical protein BN434_0899 [Erwinia amylovora CFBP 2585]QJQ59110.1 hypothetical protein EHW99_2709 [Erwinia amylovora]